MASGERDYCHSDHRGHEEDVQDTEETVTDSVLLLGSIGKLSVERLAFVLGVLLLVSELCWSFEALVLHSTMDGFIISMVN
jgi:hypothetical protein